MPRFDGTGPLGAGPRTGRGLGPCGGGMALGRGYGRGFGYRSFCCPCPYPARLTQKEETEVLSDEAEILEEELKAVKERLASLKAKK